jgi:malonyl-CoA O-methyltransferase
MKNKIKTNFDRASNSYDAVAQVQLECAKFLVHKLKNCNIDFYPNTILDLGAGTGYITELLLQIYPEASFTLNDLSPEMLKIAQKKFYNQPKMNFDVIDMEIYDLKQFDVIISNLAMQWLDNLFLSLERFFSKSKIFAFSCLLEGSFEEWSSILKLYGIYSVVRRYPTEDEILDFIQKMKTTAFFHQTKIFTLTFKNIYAFLKYLHQLGAYASNTKVPLHILKKISTLENNEFKITYKVFFGILIK